MSRSDGTATRIVCPAPGCAGRLQVRTDRTPTAVRCPRCKFEMPVDGFTAATMRQFPRPVVPELPRGGPMPLREILA